MKVLARIALAVMLVGSAFVAVAAPASATGTGRCQVTVALAKVHTPVDVQATATVVCSPAVSNFTEIEFVQIKNFNTGEIKAGPVGKQCLSNGTTCSRTIVFDCNGNGQTYIANGAGFGVMLDGTKYRDTDTSPTRQCS